MATEHYYGLYSSLSACLIHIFIWNAAGGGVGGGDDDADGEARDLAVREAGRPYSS